MNVCCLLGSSESPEAAAAAGRAQVYIHARAAIILSCCLE